MRLFMPKVRGYFRLIFRNKCFLEKTEFEWFLTLLKLDIKLLLRYDDHTSTLFRVGRLLTVTRGLRQKLTLVRLYIRSLILFLRILYKPRVCCAADLRSREERRR